MPTIRQAWDAGEPGLATLPNGDGHVELVRTYLEANWRWGREHAVQELRYLARYDLEFNLPPEPEESRGPVPTDAIEWMLAREELAGKWNRDLDQLVQRTLAEGMRTGATLDESIKALRTVFPDFSKHRLETIARTESTAAYTQGRLAWFMRPDSRVVALQFSAILDNRTTLICRTRDGLILLLTDQRLSANLPPLHFRCRSLVIPITKSQWKRLLAGDERVLDDVLGWVPEGGPKTLEEALAGWDKAEPPLPGFGEATSVKPAPAAPAPKPPDWVDEVKARMAASKTELQDMRDIGKMIAPEIEKRYVSLVGETTKAAEARLQAINVNRNALNERMEAIESEALDVLGSLPSRQELKDRASAIRSIISRAQADGDEQQLPMLQDMLAGLLDDHDRAQALFLSKQAKPFRDRWIDVQDELLKLNGQAFAAERELEEIGRRSGALRGQATLETLSRLRDFGGVSQNWAKGSAKVAKDATEEASRFLPTDWLQASRDFKPMQGKKIKRGYYRHGIPGRDSVFAVSNRPSTTGDDYMSCALHEMGHRADATTELLGAMGGRFLDDRTAGEKAVWLGRGYKRDEIAKRDKFDEHYMGKVYNNTLARAVYRDPNYTSTEIHSMGLEAIFLGRYTLDEDYLHYMLGVLSSL